MQLLSSGTWTTLWMTVLMLTVSSVSIAQNGDHPGEPQPDNWQQFDVPDSPPLSPEDELASFRIAPGFRIELVAAEPLVVDPVAIAWDEKGRLWAVEMRSFMPNVDGIGETEPIGTISVLEDSDGDGRYDKASRFLEGLVNPRAIAIVDGGVLVAEPPHLWYCRDTDGDLACDEKVDVLRYGDPNPDNLEHTENGLLLAIDNWLYSAKSSRRIRFRLDDDTPSVTVERTLFRGQWGIAQDDQGRLFYNTNSNYLIGDPLPANLLSRNPHSGRAVGQPAGAGVRIVGDESVHSIRTNTGINRGYAKGMLRSDGHLARTTSVSALEIYRGDAYEDSYRGGAFVPEPAGNLIAFFDISGDGVEIGGKQRLFDDPEFGSRAFLCSSDERFRPVDCAVGPDGCLYVVDFYRGILQHRQFVTSYLRKQIIERGLDEPVGLGRIWRVVPEKKAPTTPDLDASFFDAPAQVRSLSHDNGWIRDTAQRLLVSAGDGAIGELLVLTALEGPTSIGRIHALWTLQGLGILDTATVMKALTSRDSGVRVAALRCLAESPPPEEELLEVIAALSLSPADETRESRVHRLLALGSIEGALAREATMAMVWTLVKHAQDGHSRLAALSGWGGRQVEVLAHLLGDEGWKEPSQGQLRLFRELARSAVRSAPGQLAAVLKFAGLHEGGNSIQISLIDGVIEAMREKRFRLPELPPRLRILEREELRSLPALTGRLAEIDQRLSWQAAPRVAPREWTAQEKFLAEKGRELYNNCMLCHGPDGGGQPWLGPALIDSPWLLGNDQIAIRILLDGMTGPVEVDGVKWDATMPTQRENSDFSDENVAGLLTWLRRQWGHGGDPITTEGVARVRENTSDRIMPWTVKELREVE